MAEDRQLCGLLFGRVFCNNHGIRWSTIVVAHSPFYPMSSQDACTWPENIAAYCTGYRTTKNVRQNVAGAQLQYTVYTKESISSPHMIL